VNEEKLKRGVCGGVEGHVIECRGAAERESCSRKGTVKFATGHSRRP
jgi:hypothetical protein